MGSLFGGHSAVTAPPPPALPDAAAKATKFGRGGFFGAAPSGSYLQGGLGAAGGARNVFLGGS